MKIVFLTSVLLSVLVFSGCSIQNSNPARINSNGMGGDITDLRQETNNISESEPQNKEISINYGFLVDNVDSLTDCNFWKDKKFGKVDSYEIKTSPKDAAGSLVLKGRVVQRVKDAAFSDNGEQVTQVYLVFDNPINDEQKIYYDHYSELAGRNGVNTVDNQKLFFSLGVIENSELKTSANISEKIKNHIVSSIDKDNLVQLKLTIPIYRGTGVTDYFSFACDISE